MAVANQDLVHQLNDLIALDYDAIAAYDQAVERLQDPTCKSELANFKRDHEQHVRDLSALVSQYGGTPRQRGDMKQMMTQGMVVIRSITGDKGIMKAMKTNEDQTNAKYEKAVQWPNIPNDVRTVLEKNLADERRHRSWIVDQIDRMK